MELKELLSQNLPENSFATMNEAIQAFNNAQIELKVQNMEDLNTLEENKKNERIKIQEKYYDVLKQIKKENSELGEKYNAERAKIRITFLTNKSIIESNRQTCYAYIKEQKNISKNEDNK